MDVEVPVAAAAEDAVEAIPTTTVELRLDAIDGWAVSKSSPETVGVDGDMVTH